MNEFWMHLDATTELVQRLRNQVQPGSPGEHLINIATFLHILRNSTDIGIDPAPWSPHEDTGALFIGNGGTLQFTYGITARLTGFLNRACNLARNSSYYQSHRCDPPSGFFLECGRLLRDLEQWHISQEPLESFSDSGDITTFLASQHILAFAEGIRIYYHTRVISCDDSIMQSLVQSVASRLTGIEELKRRSGYDATPTATISWPGFIASCQASPKARSIWTTWWEQMLDYRIGNIHDLWVVVREVWKLQNAGIVDDPPWAGVLKATGRRILAI